MTDGGATAIAPNNREGDKPMDTDVRGGGERPPERTPPSSGLLTQYKSEQGKATRAGSFIGLGLLVAWGAKFLNDKLTGYQGDEAWRLLITPGIAILSAVVFGALAWHLTFVRRSTSDFMIATEGEMKKVNWSTKKEVIGSTKVVIMFTLLMAVMLFSVDWLFSVLFAALGVLKIN